MGHFEMEKPLLGMIRELIYNSEMQAKGGRGKGGGRGASP